MRRFTEGSGGRPTPAVPAELLTLMDKLAGPSDFWDRPGGDLGPLSHLYELDIRTASAVPAVQPRPRPNPNPRRMRLRSPQDLAAAAASPPLHPPYRHSCPSRPHPADLHVFRMKTVH
ncbi:predicted protein [Streptomyces viridosporus ATCC 14672]|uniref:Predicted protein n=1 Tax=Streptomyces viridosporus (strain ATCC 14672 / DSM 40746 / JCM 4963 / KCTC 9882 / NRRL B-12104 / FH 1290) TaxID=566461 RepID=D5ZU95_STRV1|nr:predicted protein [Streptomyces viridosporus ATCC 14672]